MTPPVNRLEEWMKLDSPAEAIHAAVLGCLYEDRPRAHALAAMAEELAVQQADDSSRAWADRIAGHIHHVSGAYAAAVESYQAAAEGFARAGDEKEVGRTLLSGLQALIYCSDYDRAMKWAARAEAIFTRLADHLRLARLATNVGNIYYRQDRHHEAFDQYQRALQEFALSGEPRDTAAALSNLATCSITLGEFSAALDYYTQARQHCQQHGLTNLTARADYNIAYLHYLRGDYRDAFEIYHRSRELCRQTGDSYHQALCDLDEAEMSLELNLDAEGMRLAQRAAASFAKQGLRYEEAKSLLNVAVASHQSGDLHAASRALLQARKLFLAENNVLWVALVDQLRAVLALRLGKLGSVDRLATAAWKALAGFAVPSRAAQCQILLARLWLKRGDFDRASALTEQALSHVRDHSSPSLRFHANLLTGEIHEARQRWEEAAGCYEAARREIEHLRQRLESEDLRISLIADKLSVYESLSSLCLDSPNATTLGGASRAFSLVQEAKSRTLADRLLDRSSLEALQGERNWLYRQIDMAELTGSVAGVKRAAALRERASHIEARIRLRPPATSVRQTQSCLQPGEKLIEYYEVRGHFHAFVLDAQSLHSVPLGPTAEVEQALKFVQFQLGKFRWSDRRELSSARHLEPIQSHLRELYKLLIRPIEPHLHGAAHLILAPHRCLHELPFPALLDGNEPLISRYTLSVSPSSAVFTRGRLRPLPPTAGCLVMAVPDEQASGIEREARFLADTLPAARLLLGEEASVDAFRRNAPGLRLLHLASHGLHRSDSPLFSSLQLADGRLSLFDLQALDLNIDIVTLSACHTGMAVNIAGDERIGLMRGFLVAGVRTLVAALWEIDDEATLQFMQMFYQRAQAGQTVGSSMQAAMQELRAEHPHPFFWAPFVIAGEPTSRLVS
ncbi:MAG: CHAT domain-containing protein [Bryobacteraceae bacterium]